MSDHPLPPTHASRRQFLRAALTLPAGAVLAACVAPLPTPPASSPSPAQADPAAAASAPASELASELAATPACADDDDEPTIAQTAGPYYTPNSPQRTSLLEADMAGDRMRLTGFVLTTQCAPIARALVDFWHCDAAGVYDNMGYRLRGHQFTDDQGRYTLETVVPGLYPGRTRHFHVKVQAPNGPALTTQLYFPDEPDNARDRIFHPALIMQTDRAAAAGGPPLNAAFNFVL